MTFSIFANVLKPIIGGSDNTVEFTRKLFIAMIGEDNSTVIENKSDDSFKAYYNGRSTINGIAREISPVADLENFVSFLDNFGDSVSEKLCEAFSGYINEIVLMLTSGYSLMVMKLIVMKRKILLDRYFLIQKLV